jgi:hypothetical protein
MKVALVWFKKFSELSKPTLSNYSVLKTYEYEGQKRAVAWPTTGLEQFAGFATVDV